MTATVGIFTEVWRTLGAELVSVEGPEEMAIGNNIIIPKMIATDLTCSIHQSNLLHGVSRVNCINWWSAIRLKIWMASVAKFGNL